MKLVLILMIKNESKILKRCLEAVEKLVDCFCICDTGSTDNTVEIANDFLSTRTGCLTVEPWQNFGYNRTISFQNAHTYLKENNWDLKNTYGLLLDADMVFVPGNIKEQTLTEVGYKVMQMNGTLEYYNTRLLRMDFPWKCTSVTHEYWDGGPSINIPKQVCFIDDRNDGGCKHDKFQRDQRLLEKGLEDEPTNVRYMFYLAQTYRCIGKYDDAITMYKKRIAAGGWSEEVWYSMYMLGECYKGLNNIFNFEEWMQRAHAFRPCRSESIYKLAELYRVKGDHYKAYHYTKIGLAIPFPKDDVLFIESDVYSGKFLYEASVLDYYVHQDKRIGLLDSIKFLLVCGKATQNVLSNMKFYVSPISSNTTKLDIPKVFGDNFTPSAISLDIYPYANVRFVNYWITNGDYFTKDNVPVQTENAYMNLETNEVIKMNDASITLPRYETHVKGLEDIRLYHSGDTLKFTSTSVREYEKDTVRVINGVYDKSNGRYDSLEILPSPVKSTCEKNWLAISNTDMFIYGWHPYRITNSSGKILKEIQTPPLFSFFRGSANPVKKDDCYWTLVHMVDYSKPKVYHHCLVELNKSLVPIRITLPFVFKSPSIEYCVSFRLIETALEFYVSFMDKDPHKITASIDSLQWVNI
jgi:glycosyltransferase involved in cell wall biosynthesis